MKTEKWLSEQLIKASWASRPGLQGRGRPGSRLGAGWEGFGEEKGPGGQGRAVSVTMGAAQGSECGETGSDWASGRLRP